MKPTTTAFAFGGVFLQHERVFAHEELAWLEREAAALRLRQAWRQPVGDPLPPLLESPHAHERGFWRLAAHPRLHDLMTAIAGMPLVLAETRLRFRGRLDLPPALLHALVDLGPSPDEAGAAPELDLRGRLHLVADAAAAEAAAPEGRLVFAASYHAAPAAVAAPEPDDCLWPTSLVLAG